MTVRRTAKNERNGLVAALALNVPVPIKNAPENGSASQSSETNVFKFYSSTTPGQDFDRHDPPLDPLQQPP